MVIFKMLLLLGVTCVLQSTEALVCHICSQNNDEHCLDDPENSYKVDLGQPPSGQDYYCYTDIRTLFATSILNRGFETTSENLDDVVEGPYNGTINPEENYIHVRYCQTDGCNTHPYVAPPKVNSTIKCYVCKENDGDEDCSENVASKYLIDADPIPYRTSSLGALNATKSLLSVADIIGPFEWETYCQTRYSSYSGVYVRGVSWFKIGEWEDGRCREDSTDGYRTCYCKSRDGCNDQNGSEGVRASFFAVTIFFILTNQVFFWGK